MNFQRAAKVSQHVVAEKQHYGDFQCLGDACDLTVSYSATLSFNVCNYLARDAYPHCLKMIRQCLLCPFLLFAVKSYFGAGKVFYFHDFGFQNNFRHNENHRAICPLASSGGRVRRRYPFSQ